ncbi:hypothetical protein L9F63_000465, partial [Diploptera punctata]
RLSDICQSDVPPSNAPLKSIFQKCLRHMSIGNTESNTFFDVCSSDVRLRKLSVQYCNSCFAMPKERTAVKDKLTNFVKEFGAEIFSNTFE